MKHNWKSIGIGNWFSEYQCTFCNEKDTTEPDGDYELPVDGCKGSGVIKQVIVVRKDLNMRKGKIGAQVAHGALAVTLENLDHPMVKEWLAGIFTKICVSCDSLEELLELKMKADNVDIINALIIDSGKTEFKNVATYTVLAIGPAYAEDLDKITGDLKLL